MSHQPHNISAGTQVVSLVEVRGTNNSLVHPRGAVGVVTRTPAVDGGKFIVRFPDGFEASLTLEQLEVLKHFKDRLEASQRDVPGFDLEQCILLPLRRRFTRVWTGHRRLRQGTGLGVWRKPRVIGSAFAPEGVYNPFSRF